eukprot:sb/3460848/
MFRIQLILLLYSWCTLLSLPTSGTTTNNNPSSSDQSVGNTNNTCSSGSTDSILASKDGDYILAGIFKIRTMRIINGKKECVFEPWLSGLQRALVYRDTVLRASGEFYRRTNATLGYVIYDGCLDLPTTGVAAANIARNEKVVGATAPDRANLTKYAASTLTSFSVPTFASHFFDSELSNPDNFPTLISMIDTEVNEGKLVLHLLEYFDYRFVDIWYHSYSEDNALYVYEKHREKGQGNCARLTQLIGQDQAVREVEETYATTNEPTADVQVILDNSLTQAKITLTYMVNELGFKNKIFIFGTSMSRYQWEDSLWFPCGFLKHDSIRNHFMLEISVSNCLKIELKYARRINYNVKLFIEDLTVNSTFMFRIQLILLLYSWCTLLSLPTSGTTTNNNPSSSDQSVGNTNNTCSSGSTDSILASKDGDYILAGIFKIRTMRIINGKKECVFEPWLSGLQRALVYRDTVLRASGEFYRRTNATLGYVIYDGCLDLPKTGVAAANIARNEKVVGATAPDRANLTKYAASTLTSFSVPTFASHFFDSELSNPDNFPTLISMIDTEVNEGKLVLHLLEYFDYRFVDIWYHSYSEDNALYVYEKHREKGQGYCARLTQLTASTYSAKSPSCFWFLNLVVLGPGWVRLDYQATPHDVINPICTVTTETVAIVTAIIPVLLPIFLLLFSLIMAFRMRLFPHNFRETLNIFTATLIVLLCCIMFLTGYTLADPLLKALLRAIVMFLASMTFLLAIFLPRIAVLIAEREEINVRNLVIQNSVVKICYPVIALCKQPIRTRHLGHVTGYQPIREQYFLIGDGSSYPVIYWGNCDTRNRPNQEIRVPDWLLTKSRDLKTSSDWFSVGSCAIPTCYSSWCRVCLHKMTQVSGLIDNYQQGFFGLECRKQEPTDTSKQPIETRYLGQVTGYQPIRDQYFLIWSVPGQGVSEFGEGTLRVLGNAGTPRSGEIYSLFIVPRAFTDLEFQLPLLPNPSPPPQMSIFSSTITCMEHPESLIRWRDIVGKVPSVYLEPSGLCEPERNIGSPVKADALEELQYKIPPLDTPSFLLQQNITLGPGQFLCLRDCDLRRSYCTEETADGIWKVVPLSRRSNNFVTCDTQLDHNTTRLFTLVQNTVSRGARWGWKLSVERTMETANIFILLLTALIAMSRLHHCTPAAQLTALFCVIYSAYYAVHLVSNTEAIRHNLTLCWNSGAIQSFLLQSATLLLLCAGAALHVTIEDRYDVARFILKSLCLSFGLPVIPVVTLIAIDPIISQQFTSVFVTPDILSDQTPIGCRMEPFYRRIIELAPQLLIITFTLAGLYRLNHLITNKKYKDVRAEKANMLLSMVQAVLYCTLFHGATLAMGTFASTSREEILAYPYFAVSFLQAILTLYLIGFHSTDLLSQLSSTAQKTINPLKDSSFTETVITIPRQTQTSPAIPLTTPTRQARRPPDVELTNFPKGFSNERLSSSPKAKDDGSESRLENELTELQQQVDDVFCDVQICFAETFVEEAQDILETPMTKSLLRD